MTRLLNRSETDSNAKYARCFPLPYSNGMAGDREEEEEEEEEKMEMDQRQEHTKLFPVSHSCASGIQSGEKASQTSAHISRHEMLHNSIRRKGCQHSFSPPTTTDQEDEKEISRNQNYISSKQQWTCIRYQEKGSDQNCAVRLAKREKAVRLDGPEILSFSHQP